MPPDDLLNLIALPAEGIEPAFDGGPMIPGVHLRWSFQPDLGFPIGGFEIYRRQYSFTEFGSSRLDWGDPVHTVIPPASLLQRLLAAGRRIDNELLAVLNGNLSENLRILQTHASKELYRMRFRETIAVLHQLIDPASDTPSFERQFAADDGRSSPFRIRILDAVMLASLDPYIASMLGLYWIDAVVPPGRRVDYKVVGLWGETPYPVHSYDFRRISRDQIARRDFEYDDQVHVISERSLTLDEEHALHLLGTPGLELRFAFPRPVQEVQLLISHSESSPRWRVRVQDESLVEGDLDLTGRIETLPGGIRIRSDRAFRRLVLTDESSRSTTEWILRSFQYRERTTPIGRLEAGHSVNPSPTMLDDPPRETPPAVGDRIETKGSPPGLDENGRVPLTSSRVEIRMHHSPLPRDSEKYAPVRLHVARAERTAVRPAVPLTDTPVRHFPQPQTVAFWRLNGEADDYLNPSQRYSVVEGAARQNVRLHTAHHHDENPHRRATSFHTIRAGGILGGYLQVDDMRVLRNLGTHLYFEVWVVPLEPQHSWRYLTLVDNDWRHSFWLGLRWEPGRYRLRFWLNNRNFESTRSIEVRRWSRIGVRYDGRTVRFRINGAEDNVESADLGPVQNNPRGDVFRIGASLDANADNMAEAAYPYWGSMMNLRIERSIYPAVSAATPSLLAGWSLDRTIRDAKTGLEAAVVGSTRYEQDHPQSSERHVFQFDGTRYIRVSRHPSLIHEHSRLFLQMWVNPEPDQSFPTFVGNGWRHSFWLGLHSAGGSGYRLRFWINGAVYLSDLTISANQWSYIGVGYDGQSVTFYINDRIDAIHAARHGPVKVNPEHVLCLGASAYSRPGVSPQYPFRGKLADVHIWADVPALPWPVLLVKPEEDEPPADFIDHAVPDGAYIYNLQTIDIFGRVAHPTSTVAIDVRDELKPSPPVSPYADFRPLTGRITALSEDHITTDISLPASLSARELIRYDLQVQQVAADRSVYREPFMIEPPDPGDLPGAFKVRAPLFPRLRPAVGDAVAIGYDINLMVRWSWTGLQRLFTPRATWFQAYMHTGAFNRWRGTITGVEKVAFNRFAVRTDPRLDAVTAGVIGINGLAGSFMYAIEPPPSPAWHVQLRYNAAPIQSPRVGTLLQVNIPASSPFYVDFGELSAWHRVGERVPLSENVVLEQGGLLTSELVSPDEKRRLRDQGVDWITEEAQFYALTLRGVDLPPRFHNLKPADYVPGGLVGFNETDNQNEWQAFSVLWYTWEEGGAVRLYFAHESESESLPRLSKIRYYPGERFERTITLNVPPTFTPAQGTVEYVIAVTTIDNKGAEGPMSSMARAIAVNRRRPPDPPRPIIVDIGRPDYYGQSQVKVEWIDSGDGVVYQLYRATDTAVYTRDMEQRRLRSGFYAGLSAEQVFDDDDPDFQDWIIVMGNRLEIADLATTWQTRLFVPKPASLRPEPGEPANPEWEAWDAATPIWRAWAERFYPALTDAQLIDIAERGGDETAFALVNESPITGTEYVDSINGRVRNRYLYRLRTMSNTLLSSTEWGSVGILATSTPESPILPASPMAQPPRAPVFTKIQAGDRKITLHWALNREPDLKEYRLYRTETREELDDLRWWEERPHPRILTIIPDPRLKVSSDHIEVQIENGATDVYGVYRADEFDYSQELTHIQPTAFNYFQATGTAAILASTWEVVEPHLRVNILRPIANGTHVIVVYADNEAIIRYQSQISPMVAPPYHDDDLIPLQDYFYRLIAVDMDDNLLRPSDIVTVQCVDTRVPAPPIWRVAEWILVRDADETEEAWPPDDIIPDGRSPAIRLEWESEAIGASFAVTRKTRRESVWKLVASEGEYQHIDANRFSFVDKTVVPEVNYSYRIRVISQSGVASMEYRVVDLAKP